MINEKQSNEAELFKKILNDSNMAVYISDAATLELLFVSDKVRSFFPKAADSLIGTPCYKALIGRGKPCTFCHRERLSEGSLCEREHFFKAFGKDYIFSGKTMELDGKLVIVDYVYDNTAAYEEQRRLKDHYYSQITLMSDVAPNALGTYRMNLTKNTMRTPLGKTSVGFEKEKPETVDEFFEYAYEHCGTLEDERAYSEKFSRAKLMQTFNEGVTKTVLDHQYFMEPDRQKWIRTAVSMARNPSNGDVEAILYTVDIDKEKIMEQMLASIAENEYDSLFLLDAVTGEGVDVHGGRITTDSDTDDSVRFDYAKVLHRMIKKKSADLEPQTVEEKLSLPQITKELMEHRQYDVYFMVYDNTGRRLHKKSSFYRIEASRRLICNTVQDVTAALENEEKKNIRLREALETAKVASNAKTEFLRRVSRGIRTPLNSIIGLTQIAKSESHDPAAVVEYLNGITTSGDYMNGLIDEILDLNRIEDNCFKLEPEVVDVREFLHVLDSIMQPRMSGKGIHSTYETRNLVTQRVMADKFRLEKIFIKLLENAARFTPAGGEVNMTVTELLRREDAATLRFDVKDSGIGISPERLEGMFSSLFDEEEDDGRDERGSGLALTKKLVALMGGTLTAESTEGQGTIFHVSFTFPVARENESGKFNEIPEGRHYDFSGRKVLIAEDHTLNLEIAKRLLENVGFEVYAAGNGQEAVDAFSRQENHFDIILMDIRMPIKDGLTAASEIRALDRNGAKDIPIIAMTANAFDTDIKRSFAAGMNEHLAKPINPDKLYATLSKFIKE